MRDLLNPTSLYILEPDSYPPTPTYHGDPQGIEMINAFANIEFTYLDFTKGVPTPKDGFHGELI